jgi:hypothetical protein
MGEAAKEGGVGLVVTPRLVDAQRAGEDPPGITHGDADAAPAVIDAGHAALRNRL